RSSDRSISARTCSDSKSSISWFCVNCLCQSFPRFGQPLSLSLRSLNLDSCLFQAYRRLWHVTNSQRVLFDEYSAAGCSAVRLHTKLEPGRHAHHTTLCEKSR